MVVVVIHQRLPLLIGTKNPRMGYDITFHGISDDLEGVAMRQLLGRERSVPDLVNALPNCVDDLPDVCNEWFNILLEEQDSENEYLASMLSYRLAMVSGYHRPCWYCRGMQGISFWSDSHPELLEMITPTTRWVGGPVEALPDPSRGVIIENYVGSGVVNDPALLLEWYQSVDLGYQVDEEGDWAFRSALQYCIENKLSFIEVSDVYSPMAGATINVEQTVNAMHLKKDG